MRLKSSLWVKAYIRTCFSHNSPCAVIHKGDEDAGQIYIKCNHLNGNFTLYGPAVHFAEDTMMARKFEPKSDMSVSESVVDDILAKQQEFDPDIWIVELESKDGQTHLFDQA